MVVRRSPVVLIRTFAFIEVAAFAAYLLSLGGGSTKYDLYSQLPLAGLFPYQTAKILFLSGAQFLITIYAFLRWYRERYVIRPNILVHERGVFLRNRREVRISEAPSVTLSVGFLGKLFRYGTVRIAVQGEKPFVLGDISSPQGHFADIARTVRASSGERPDLSKLVQQEEDERLEFKSSLRFDPHVGRVNRDLEKATMKSVAAFLNSDGGRIVLGVDDTRHTLGLENDYGTIQRPTSDGFENHFTQVFNAMIGPELRHLVKLWFEKRDGHDVCVVDIAQSAHPVYLRTDNSEHFYVRTGNTTTALKLSEVATYVSSRWPDRTHLA